MPTIKITDPPSEIDTYPPFVYEVYGNTYTIPHAEVAFLSAGIRGARKIIPAIRYLRTVHGLSLVEAKRVAEHIRDNPL